MTGIKRIAMLLIVPLMAAGLPTAAIVVGEAATAPPAHATPLSNDITGGTMELDTVMHGDLSSYGDIDTWKLSIATGALVTPTMYMEPDDPYQDRVGVHRHWHLRDDDGRTMFDGDFEQMPAVYLAPADTQHPYVLTVTGTRGNTIGWGGEPLPPTSYSFEFITRRADVFSIAFPAIGGITTIPTDVVAQPGRTAGKIDKAGATDVYTFDVPSPGRRTYLQRSTVLGEHWQLIDPTGRVVFDNGAASTGPLLLPPGVGYRLTVYFDESHPVGEYFVTLQTDLAITPPPPPAMDTFSIPIGDPGTGFNVPGDIRNENIVSPSTASAGNIDGPGSTDVFRFHADAGDRAYLLGSATTPSLSAWQLRGPDGLLVPGLSLAPVGDAHTLSFTESGDYMLTVYDTDSRTNTYTFNLMRVLPAQVFDIAKGETVNSNGTVTPAPPGNPRPAPAAGRIANRGENDVFRFDAVAGERIYLKTLLPSGIGQIYWSLQTPDGQPMGVSARTGSDLGAFRIPYSGRYSIVVKAYNNGRDVGSYSFSVASIARIPGIELGTLISGAAVPIANNVAVPGDRNTYFFTAATGQQLTVSGTSGLPNNLLATLVGPDGIPVIAVNNTFPTIKPRLENVKVNVLSAYTITVPRDGRYQLVITGDTANQAYSFSLNPSGTATTSPPSDPPIPMWLDDSAPLHIVPNSPRVGAGIIEAPGAEDTFEFSAESGGGAYNFWLIKTALAQRPRPTTGVGFYTGCGTSSPKLEWTVRDAHLDVVSDLTFSCEEGGPGPLVLADAGVYTVTVGGATALDTYELIVTPIPVLREAPQSGQESGPPALTRSEPATGPAGRSTTVSLYGTNMPAPTAVHVKRGTTELPVTLGETHSVHGDIPAIAATATIDMSALSNTSPVDYVITVDLPNGSTVTTGVPFTVLPASATIAEPTVNVTTYGLDDIRIGAVNHAYVNLSNPTASDILTVLQLWVPDGFGTVRLYTPVNRSAILSTLRLRGIDLTTDDLADAFATPVAYQDPEPDEAGDSVLTTAPLQIAAGTSISVSVEIDDEPAIDGVSPPQPIRTSAVSTMAVPLARSAACGATREAKKKASENMKWWWYGWAFDLVGTPVADLINREFGPLSPEDYDLIKTRVADAAAAVAVLVIVPLVKKIILAAVGKAVRAATGNPLSAAAAAAIGALIGTAWGGRGALSQLNETKRIHDANWQERNSCDPNALIGPGVGDREPAPGATVDGGAVRANQLVPYKVEFENLAGSAPAQLVTADVTLSDKLDWSKLQLGDIVIGSTHVTNMGRLEPVPSGALSASGSVDVPINGTTTTVGVDAVFNPTQQRIPDINGDLEPGRLRVTLAGPPVLPAPLVLHPGPTSDFLPANDTPPQGEGSITYWVPVKDLPVGTEIVQESASIVFDNNAPVLTNTWKNKVRDDYQVGGSKLSWKGLTKASARKLGVKLSGTALSSLGDPTVTGMKLHLASEAGDVIFDMPASDWSGWGTKYWYRASTRVTDPLKALVTIDESKGRMTISWKQASLPSFASATPSYADIELLVPVASGTRRVCAHFGGIAKASAGKYFKAKNAPTPLECLRS